MTQILSPCVRLCTIDPPTALCVGCGRSLAEIGNWLRYCVAERRALMASLPARLEALRAAVPAS